MSRNFSFNDTFFEIRDFDWSRRARSRIWVNWVSFYGNAFRRKLTWSIVMNNFRLSLVVLRTHCSAKRVSNLLCRRTLGLTDFSAHLLWTSKEVEGFQALVSNCCCVSWERTFYLLLFCCASHIAQWFYLYRYVAQSFVHSYDADVPGSGSTHERTRTFIEIAGYTGQAGCFSCGYGKCNGGGWWMPHSTRR